MPNLLPIDYGVGLPGSQHDATAWAETRVPREHKDLLPNGEWIWGDSAYPLMSYPWLWTHIPTLVTYGQTSPNTLRAFPTLPNHFRALPTLCDLL
jgi:hypothetical protein